MKIKLGTFNLYQFVKPPYSWYIKKSSYAQEQWTLKTSWIKKQIEKMDCDIIGFEEVFSPEALESILKDLGFNYFQTVDKARLCEVEETTYISTTVAIASKYPILNLQEVIVDKDSLNKHNFTDTFKFSRIPLKATIELPNKKELLVYVCHLKSNRQNELEYIFSKNDNLKHKKEKVNKALQNDGSNVLKQRLCEASSLFFDIQKEKDKNIILLCDLNDREFSLTIDALTNKKYHNNIEEEYILNDASYEYKQTSYNPHPEAKKVKRKYTSYFQGRGSVLDYIFISNSFSKNSKRSIAEVTSHIVLDEHLKNNNNNYLLTSDHAQVVCEITFKKE